GPGAAGAPVGGGVGAGEGVEPGARVAQLRGEGGEGEGGVHGSAGGDDAERQRQPHAALDDLGGGVGFGGHAWFAEPAGQQLAGLVDAEQVDEQRPGALDGQTGELVAAGDQDQAGRCTGQQRPDLLGVAGVVEQYQYPL